MDNSVMIFNKPFEYDFLSGWIKYNRMEKGISQEALAFSICSVSHLSNFQNGKKKLRPELIEALLKKLGIHNIIEVENIGLIREKFYNLKTLVESFDNVLAESTYNELLPMEELLESSPYNIEFKIYKLMYNIMVERKSYDDLHNQIIAIDKIYTTLNSDLQYLYMLITGKLIYDFKDHKEGLSRLLVAHELKDTPWVNYRLGVGYTLSAKYLKGIYHLEKALDVYQVGGRYRNSLNCHSFLSTCYEELEDYETAEMHLKAIITGSDYFNIPKNALGIYTSMASLYYSMQRYEDSLKWSLLAMNENNNGYINDVNSRWTNTSWYTPEQPLIGACIYIKNCIKLNKISQTKEIFNRYLTDKYKNFINYNYLKFLYLSIFHFNEDIFFKEVTETILPYYQKLKYKNSCRTIQLKIIEYLENNRRYKEATKIYKELLR